MIMKRDQKKADIIRNAKEVFLEMGFFGTVMDSVAEKSSITRRTLYRYFDTKEDIAYEVTILLLNQWNDFQKNIFSGLQGTGLEKLSSFLNQLIDHMSDKRDVMAYLGEFDFYFKDGAHNQPSDENIKKFDSIILESDELLNSIIAEGVKDKSINDNIDINITVATISNVLWSFAQRISIREHLIQKETGYEGVQLIKNQVKLYIMALRK